MKIGIIGFNIFGIGGTSQSNINLLKELNEEKGIELTYFNAQTFFEFQKKDFILENDFHSDIKFKNISDIDSEYLDCYIITRESLLPLARFIKSIYPSALIIGEIHTPLSLLGDNIDFYPRSIDVFRVASESIKLSLNKILPDSHIVSFPISTRHISFDKYNKMNKTHNFYTFSRLDYSQKDIKYMIDLFDSLVNENNLKEYKLYLYGEGKDKQDILNTIKNKNLTDNIFVNEEIPKNSTFISTSRVETFGYSIAEALSKGNKLVLYVGDDNVVYETFSKFHNIYWIYKTNFKSDVRSLKKSFKSNTNERNHIENSKLFNDLSNRENYAREYIDKLINNTEILPPIKDSITKQEIFEHLYHIEPSLKQNVLKNMKIFIDYLMKDNTESPFED